MGRPASANLLGESIARSTNRKFVRMACGRVRDEAEIRGHRRTYIGSMPGKLLQKMAKAGVKNPLCSCWMKSTRWVWTIAAIRPPPCLRYWTRNRITPSMITISEVDYDLSDVMFVCTSNTMNIPGRCWIGWRSFVSPAIPKTKTQYCRTLPESQTDQAQWPEKGELAIGSGCGARHHPLLYREAESVH